MTTVIAEWSGPYQSAMTTVIAGGYAVGVDAGEEPSRTPASSEQPSARERIVRSAAALVRERGVHGVGLRQIVTHADGPRGSLQRYFPGGKTQLITEALKLVGAEVLGETESRLVEATTLAKCDRRHLRPMAPGSSRESLHYGVSHRRDRHRCQRRRRAPARGSGSPRSVA